MNTTDLPTADDAEAAGQDPGMRLRGKPYVWQCEIAVCRRPSRDIDPADHWQPATDCNPNRYQCTRHDTHHAHIDCQEEAHR